MQIVSKLGLCSNSHVQLSDEPIQSTCPSSPPALPISACFHRHLCVPAAGELRGKAHPLPWAKLSGMPASWRPPGGTLMQTVFFLPCPSPLLLAGRTMVAQGPSSSEIKQLHRPAQKGSVIYPHRNVYKGRVQVEREGKWQTWSDLVYFAVQNCELMSPRSLHSSLSSRPDCMARCRKDCIVPMSGKPAYGDHTLHGWNPLFPTFPVASLLSPSTSCLAFMFHLVFPRKQLEEREQDFCAFWCVLAELLIVSEEKSAFLEKNDFSCVTTFIIHCNCVSQYNFKAI